MKIYGLIGTALAVLLLGGTCLADSPDEIAGIKLGRDIGDYKQALDLSSALPVRYSEYIKEVEIANLPGFKSGLIGYGTCAEPGKILRIKLKYADGSKAFYERLLKRFKERFGEPAEWRGDPFHLFVAWKWSFTDKNNTLSMILQHNDMDEEQKMGNAVKLTRTNRLENERECYEKNHPETREAADDPKTGISSPADWDRYLPH